MDQSGIREGGPMLEYSFCHGICISGSAASGSGGGQAAGRLLDSRHNPTARFVGDIP